MRTLLRRMGIIAFTGLSFVLWKQAAYTPIAARSSLLSGPRTLLLGASLACLAVLLLSELSGWGMSLLESTRREFVVAELRPVSRISVDYPEEQVFLQHPSDGELPEGAHDLVKEDDSGRREWVDMRQRDLAEALRP